MLDFKYVESTFGNSTTRGTYGWGGDDERLIL
jgi:hypothetical protein